MPTTLIARYDDVVTVLHDHERFTVRRPEIPVFASGSILLAERRLSSR